MMKKSIIMIGLAALLVMSACTTINTHTTSASPKRSVTHRGRVTPTKHESLRARR